MITNMKYISIGTIQILIQLPLATVDENKINNRLEII